MELDDQLANDLFQELAILRDRVDRLGAASIFRGGAGSGGSSRTTGGGVDLPVAVGGSGATYNSLADAIAGESSQSISAIPQAGTTAGVLIIDAALSQPANFYKDFFVVNLDPTPSNGLVCRSARVASSAGSTLTLDQPWDFVAESLIALVQTARVALVKDADGAAIPKDLELDLAGHRVRGGLDVTGGSFCWIRGGSGFVTNGLQKTNIGYLQVDDTSVSRRDATIYAVLLTTGSDLGRLVVNKCEFAGRVASRRGFIGYEQKYCTNFGVPNSTSADLPYTVVEALSGTITLSQLDVDVVGEFSGALVYAEGTATVASVGGGTTMFSFTMDITIPGGPPPLTSPLTPAYRRVAIFSVTGAATLTFTKPATCVGVQNVFVGSKNDWTRFAALPIQDEQNFITFLHADSFTGIVTMTLTFATSGSTINLATVTLDAHLVGLAAVVVTGSTMSGSVTLSGSEQLTFNTPTNCSCIALLAKVSGTISFGIVTVCRGSAFLVVIRNFAVQDTGAPSVTASGTYLGQNCTGLNPFNFANVTGASVSVGTWTVSGAVSEGRSSASTPSAGLATIAAGTAVVVLSAQLTHAWNNGGTFTFTAFVANIGAGSTFTVSSARIDITANVTGTFRLVSAGSGTGTFTISTPIINIRGALGGVTAVAGNIVTCTGGTVTLTGVAITLREMRFEAAFTEYNISAGATLNRPTSITYYHCVWESTFTDEAGAGTFAGTSTKLIHESVLRGLLTILGTAYTSVQAFDSKFTGVTATGTRPATYQFFRCSFSAADYDSLTPDIVETWFVLPSAAALTRGQLVELAGATVANQGVAAVNVGVVLDAVGGAAVQTIVVTKGRIFVDVAAGVVAGAALIVDAAGVPTQAITAATAAALVLGQTIGSALEATGATVAGEAYSEVNVR